MKPTDIKTIDFEVQVWSHVAEVGVGLEDILKPDYWTHVASRFKPGSRIDVQSADGSWYALLIVRAASRLEAITQALIYTELGAATPVTSEESPYEVKWRGPAKRFGVIRKEDGGVMIDELQTKESAAQWLKNHIASLSH